MRSGPPSAFLAFFLLLAACAPLPTPLPQPSPQPLVMAMDPLLEPIRPILASCLPSGYGLYEADPTGKVDARLTWNEPSTSSESPFRFVLGSERIVWIANPENPAASLSVDQLRQVYAGAADPALRLTAWTYPPENPARSLLGIIPGWKDPLSAQVQVAANPTQMLKAIAADPAAIGYVPLRWVDASVKTLPISGLDPAALSQPILASTNSEPVGAIKDWLLCVQQDLGKN